ncbi:hypothetical protein ABZ832_28555 [Streptantibioticus parmotrematis]|uniref:hypothetical protein n=1 Tax=Streptantibioticus parmotrematis TaxID=2873249 RepID=UPI0033FC58ED
MDFHNDVGRPMSETEAAAEAKRIIETEFQPEQTTRLFPTSFRDDSPLPRYGNTPPVPQYDKRLVPAWAAGIAVASIGVGAGITGIGCGAWLILRGLAAVTLDSVLMVTLPIAAVAVVVTAAGGVFSKLRAATSITVHNGPVYQHHESHQNRTYGLFARTRTDIHH